MSFTSPLSVDLNITNRCSLKCSFCSASAGELTSASNEMSFDKIKSLLDELENMGVFLVRFAGGEPFMRRDIKKILELLNDYSFDKVFLTNGMHLNKDICESLGKVKSLGLGISIDGDSSKIHDASRGVVGAFSTTIKNILNLQDFGIKYSMMSTVSKKNVMRMPEILQMASDLGFSSVRYLILCLTGRSVQNSTNDFVEFKEWSSGFMRLHDFIYKHKSNLVPATILPPHEEDLPFEIYMPLKETNRLDELNYVWGIDLSKVGVQKKIGCAAGSTQLTIFEDGSVFGCDLMRDSSALCAGNVYQSKIQEIWDHSQVFKTLREMNKVDLEGQCGSCPVTVCGGGCRAAAFNTTKSIKGSDLSCGLHRA